MVNWMCAVTTEESHYWSQLERLNTIILESLKEPLDSQLQEQQAGFQQHRCCSDQIITLRITTEQSIEWNSSLLYQLC